MTTTTAQAKLTTLRAAYDAAYAKYEAAAILLRDTPKDSPEYLAACDRYWAAAEAFERAENRLAAAEEAAERGPSPVEIFWEAMRLELAQRFSEATEANA
jgi:hypothetical protein